MEHLLGFLNLGSAKPLIIYIYESYETIVNDFNMHIRVFSLSMSVTSFFFSLTHCFMSILLQNKPLSFSHFNYAYRRNSVLKRSYHYFFFIHKSNMLHHRLIFFALFITVTYTTTINFFDAQADISFLGNTSTIFATHIQLVNLSFFVLNILFLMYCKGYGSM
jgi:hypothetical protein